MTTIENPQHEVAQDPWTPIPRDDPHHKIKEAFRLGYLAGQEDASIGRDERTYPEVTRHDVACPSWCTSEDGHLEERWVEDVSHHGPKLPPVEVWNDAGGLSKALEVQVWSGHEKDGQPWQEPMSAVHLDADGDVSDLTVEDAREMVGKLRAHLEAVEAYIERYSA